MSSLDWQALSPRAKAQPQVRAIGAGAPIRALFVLPSLEGGGAQRVTLNLLRLLSRDLVAPTLMFFQRAGSLLAELPDRLPLYSACDIPGRLDMLRIVRELVALAFEADIVVAALQCRTTYLCWLAGAITRRPVIGWVQNTPVPGSPMARRSHRTLMGQIQPRLAASVFTCERAYQSLAAQIPLSGTRIEIIPNFINGALVRHLAGSAVPSLPARDSSTATLVAVGRLAPAKGFDILLRALHRLHQNGHRCRLVILGEGPERAYLAALTAMLELNEFVEMPGFVPNPYAVMRAADVFVLSSRHEGLPLTLLEARALRMPIVATDCVAGPREILEHGRYGTLVPINDSAALAAAIAEVIGRPRDHPDLSEYFDDESDGTNNHRPSPHGSACSAR
jgi:glycosyltransferase involved in cell wall biosynthesis